MTFTETDIRDRILAGQALPNLLPTAFAGHILGLTKSGVLRKVEAKSARLKLISFTAGDGTVWNGITAESLAEEVQYMKNHVPNTARLVLKQLHTLAKAGATANYGDFMAAIDLSWQNPNHRKLVGYLLGLVSERVGREHQLVLSVLVVNKLSQKPSDAFFQLAKDVGLFDPKAQKQGDFFIDMKDKVCASANSREVWAWHESYEG